MNIMNKILELRQKYMTYMQGRYGIDELSKSLGAAAIVLMVIAWIVGTVSAIALSPAGGIVALCIDIVVLIIFIFIGRRTISMDVNKEYFRNQKFIYYRDKIAAAIKDLNDPEAKKHRVFKCPKCKQKIRVPRGKGKIAITCPKCRTEFVKKS